MKARLTVAAAAICLALGVRLSAHRLDEYLQAALISVESNRVEASLRLVPGVAVAAAVIAGIDRDGDGVISEAEGRAYAGRVLGDLVLSIDGKGLKPRLVSVAFPGIGELREGLGQIEMEFRAELPEAVGGKRRLVFENHHQSGISVYLVNALAPRDRRIQIAGQTRNVDQSFYQLEYAEQGGVPAGGLGAGVPVGFASIFRLGMRHIAEGTDHLLFLLALLLPAPLMAAGSRWAGAGGVKRGVLRILKVVTAFTVGHSITLALAGLGLASVPSRPTEVLIAVSILVSAVHALRPIFPGREAAIAAFFGLVHGLAFAATLGNLGLSWRERVASVLGFNLGIEAMQLMAVAAVMPSLILLSRTRMYSMVRIGGAVFAGLAAMGWIGERLFGLGGEVWVGVSVAVGIGIIPLFNGATDQVTAVRHHRPVSSGAR